MYSEPACRWKVYGAGFQARVSPKNATRQPRRSRITGCSAMSRPNPEPTNRPPARVSRRIVSSTAAGPPSHAWLLAVLTTSKPARASAAAAAGGAVNIPPESRATLEAGARSEEHTSELQSQFQLVCRLLLEKTKKINSLPSLYKKKKKIPH